MEVGGSEWTVGGEGLGGQVREEGVNGGGRK